MKPARRNSMGLWVKLGYLLVIICLLNVLVDMIYDEMPHVSPQAQREMREAALMTAAYDYKDRYGHFPAGTNSEIARQLRGANPDHITFINLRPSDLNQTGEVVDASGRPFVMIETNSGFTVQPTP